MTISSFVLCVASAMIGAGFGFMTASLLAAARRHDDAH